jgi:hypothetical protein
LTNAECEILAMKNYKILINKETYQKAICYVETLKTGIAAGGYLKKVLKNKDLFIMTPVEFFEMLIGTKVPQIFAESSVCGDGTDWNQDELSILGDINIAVPVTVFDDGRHYEPAVHRIPFKATLVFTPGALLRNGRNNIPADWKEVTENGEINPDKYYRLYERRLLPAFIYVDRVAKNKGRMAFITVPGLGCGQFAGRFRGRLGSELKNTLKFFLENHSTDFPNIRAVYYDPYQECENERYEIDGTSFIVRPLTKGNENKSQLCRPEDYEEYNNEFDKCELFSFVAWDHVSWPGNDFYTGSRSTDDGVKAAATDVMYVLTDIEGKYDISSNRYNPPPEYKNWQEAVFKNGIQIEAKDNFNVYP